MWAGLVQAVRPVASLARAVRPVASLARLGLAGADLLAFLRNRYIFSDSNWIKAF